MAGLDLQEHNTVASEMSDIIQDIIFHDSGLDSDSEQRYVALGDSPCRLNVLVGEDGAVGVLTNMLGNSKPLSLTTTC